jgi:hypothetical protein
LIARYGLDTNHKDAINAFLNAMLKEELYTTMTEDFETNGKVWLVLRTLYGLRKSPILSLEDLSKKKLNDGCRARRKSSRLKVVRCELPVAGAENIASVNVLWPLRRLMMRDVSDNERDFGPPDFASSAVPSFPRREPRDEISSSASSAEVSPNRFSSQPFGRLVGARCTACGSGELVFVPNRRRSRAS